MPLFFAYVINRFSRDAANIIQSKLTRKLEFTINIHFFQFY